MTPPTITLPDGHIFELDGDAYKITKPNDTGAYRLLVKHSPVPVSTFLHYVEEGTEPEANIGDLLRAMAADAYPVA